tara:strand:+ start:440 stop:1012 length:573 start_codon:yes stop_codon:yes gene_type:complete
MSEVAAIGRHMAKSDSFYIRAQTDAASGGAYAQTEIDLGSFVNLGVKSSTLLRIHNIAVQYADGTIAGGISPELPMHATAAGGGKVAFQLTTQSQTSMVSAVDKSLVASGALMLYGDPNSTAHGVSASHDIDVGPQSWRNGYLVGVDSMFLGAEAGGTVASGDSVVSIVLECTLENATQATATALALSQQ